MLVIYLFAINLITFLVYGEDKRRAKCGAWRISENMLIGLAAAGGSVGAYIGMQCFRHKTKHMKFVVGIPVIFLIQAGILWKMI